MNIDIPKGIGTLILSGCGNSNTVELTEGQRLAGKSHRCGVDDLCLACKLFIYKRISELFKSQYSNKCPQGKTNE